jgi:hypothetical protein
MEEHGRGERLIQSGKDTKTAITASTARLTAAERETARETTRGLTATAASTRRGLSNVAETVRRKNLAVTVRNNNIIRVNNQISIRDTARKLSFSQNMAIYG